MFFQEFNGSLPITSEIICCVCKIPLTKYVINLKDHLISYHTTFLTNLTNIECFQPGCSARFETYKSYKKHLVNTHKFSIACLNETNLSESEDDEVIPEENIQEISHQPEVVEENIAETPESDVDDELVNIVGRLVKNLRSKPNFTQPILQDVLDACNDATGQILQFLKNKAESFCETHQINNVESENLLGYFDIPDVFTRFKSLTVQRNFLLSSENHVNATEIILGQRTEYQQDASSSHSLPKQTNETFQYVSIIDTLSVLMQHKEFREEIYKPKISSPHEYCSFNDGSCYLNCKIFQDHPNALQIVIYYDDVEVSNPLASAAGIHKLGAFYFSLNNIDRKFISKVKNIYTTILAYSEDIKKYGMNKILCPLIQEMKKLENGVMVKTQDGDFEIFGTICL